MKRYYKIDRIEYSDYVRESKVTMTGKMMVIGDNLRAMFSDKRE